MCSYIADADRCIGCDVPVFCQNLPVPENLVNVCGEKPAGYKQNWHIDEKIEYLKKNLPF
jgi:hypothetical protein